MFLAFDVGNTAVKAGLHDGTGWVRVARFASEAASAAAWAERLRQALGDGAVDAAGLASVAPAVEGPLAEAAARVWGVGPVDVRATMAVPAQLAPFHVAYQTPGTLGADRLAAAAAAYHRFGRPAGRAVIAVDAGTAITLDAVTAEGAHLGGAILPGPVALVGALARGTAQLPEVAFERPASPIGGSTVEAIQSGVAHLLLDGLAGLLGRTAAALGGDVIVVGTGGWAPWLAAHAALDRVEPHLVLDGVRLLSSG